MTLIYPGSFDPVTTGHMDIAKRAKKFASHIIIAVLNNPVKNTLFTVEERIGFLQEAFAGEQFEIAAFSGLLADYAFQRGANAIIRGLRTSEDFETENKYAASNSALSSALFARQIETIFIPASPALTFVSSSIIREAAAHIYKENLDDSFIAGLVPPTARLALKNTYS
jgi:pantetheine-phosphate adenylyltransferase